MKPIVVFTPAYVTAPNELEMVRIQSLLASRLRKAGPRTIVPLVVYDRLDLNSGRLFENEIIVEGEDRRFQDGIRNPTEVAIRWALKNFGEDATLLRVIQDTFIEDPASVLRQISSAEEVPGYWVSGRVDKVHYEGDRNAFRKIALQAGMRTSCEQLVVGEVVAAPVKTWRDLYLRMPKSVHHFHDDLCFSQMVVQSGGRMIEMSPAWEHLHDATVEECAWFYGRHSQ
jgi:hypothetical protein